MSKKINIDGMMCEHCKKHVEEALIELGFNNVDVNLNGGYAVVEDNDSITDEMISQTIDDQGYTVVSFE